MLGGSYHCGEWLIAADTWLLLGSAHMGQIVCWLSAVGPPIKDHQFVWILLQIIFRCKIGTNWCGFYTAESPSGSDPCEPGVGSGSGADAFQLKPRPPLEASNGMRPWPQCIRSICGLILTVLLLNILLSWVSGTEYRL